MGQTITYLKKMQDILEVQDRDLDKQEEQIRKQRAGIKEQSQLLEDARKHIISCGAKEMKVTRLLEKLT